MSPLSRVLRRSRPAVLACIVAPALCLASCATNPVTGRRQVSFMGEGQEVALGQRMDPQIRQELGVYDDAEWQRYVTEIGSQLARGSHRPQLPWSFAVVDTPTVNAFALPGGYIYVTRGLLAHLGSEAELAGVLGHEIGHVTARHAAEQYTRSTSAQLGLALGSILFPEVRPYGDLAGTGLGLLALRYGRQDEIEADRLGAEYASRSGWDPAGIAGMLRTLGRLGEARTDRRGVPNWLSTHPDPATRVQEIEPVVARLRPAGGADAREGRDAYLRRLDGLMFGDNPKEGLVRGRTFVHPGLRIAVEFPDGWPVQNAPSRVSATAPDGQQLMFLDVVPPPREPSLGDVARRNMAAAGLRPIDGRPERLDAADAFVGTFEGQLQSGGRVLARAAYIAAGSNVYRLAGVATERAFPGAERRFDEAIQSFRQLSAAEAERIRPLRVHLHTVGPGETWASIAQGPSAGNLTPAALAVLNGASAGEPPRAGDRVKVVR